MKKLITILFLAVLAGCAKEPAFDPVEAKRLVDVVTWLDPRHDGALQRALVSLVR